VSSERAVVHLEEPKGARWQAALQALREGHLISFGNLVVGLEWEGPRKPGPSSPVVIEIPVPDWWRHDMSPETKSHLDEAIESARALLSQLKEDSAFRSFAEARSTRIELVRDYGNGAVLAGTVREDGTVEWAE
jgi:hypothetical protein